MDNLLIIANWLLPLGYLALVIDYGAAFFLRVRTHVRNPWTIVVIVAHAAFLLLRGIHLGHPPLTDNYGILSALAISTAVVYWGLEFIGRDRRAGLFVFLLVFLFQYTSSVLLAQAVTVGAAQSARVGWARLHVIPATFAYTALTFAGVYGLLHLIAQRNLKQHRFGVLFDSLPPLDLLGKMTWYALVVGFVFMTISMITGPFLFEKAKGAERASVWDPKIASKIVIGSIAWLVCLVAITGRALGKWSSTWISRIAVIGFLVVMIMLVISAILS